MNSSSVQNDLWDCFLFTVADFYSRLRMVKYKFINIKSAMKKKKKRSVMYRALKPFYEKGLTVLENAGIRRDQQGKFETKTCGEVLPPGTQCVGCAAHLGGLKAQLLLPPANGDIRTDDFDIIKVADTPCVLEMLNVNTGKEHRHLWAGRQL